MSRWWTLCYAHELKFSPLSLASNGWRGEERLYNGLTELSLEGLGIFGYRLGPQSDIDFLLVTPKGIWVVESKFWQGRVERTRDGSWYQDPEGSGRQREPRNAPDRQVLRQRGEVVRLLQQALPGQSWSTWVRAAVVFTHRGTRLHLQGLEQNGKPGQEYWMLRNFKIPVFCGTIPAFLAYLEQAPSIPALENPLLWYRVADALFLHEAHVVGPSLYWKGDARDLAQRAVREAMQDVEEWASQLEAHKSLLIPT